MEKFMASLEKYGEKASEFDSEVLQRFKEATELEINPEDHWMFSLNSTLGVREFKEMVAKKFQEQFPALPDERGKKIY